MKLSQIFKIFIVFLSLVITLFPLNKALSQTASSNDTAKEDEKKQQQDLRFGLERYPWVDTQLDQCEVQKEESTSSSSGGSTGASASSSAPIQPSGDLPEDITKKINENKDVYVEAGEKTNVPWQLLAAVHYRETGLNRYNPGNGDGAYQIVSKNYPPKSELTREEFLQESIDAGEFLQGKVGSNLPNHRTPLQKDNNDPEVIKDTLYSYNGRAKVYAAQAAALGFDPNTQPYEGSPYIMNKFDDKRQSMGIITRDGGGISGHDTRYGSFTIFSKIAGMSGACGAEDTGLEYPDNLGQPDNQGYYQMPESDKGEYVFYDGTCDRERWGKKELIGFAYTLAKRWKAKNPGNLVKIGDMNANTSEHETHKWGIAVDLYTQDGSANLVGAPNYSQDKAVEFGQMMLDTKLVRDIWFHDQAVLDRLKGYAESKGLPYKNMEIEGKAGANTHLNHWHVNIDVDKGPEAPKIDPCPAGSGK